MVCLMDFSTESSKLGWVFGFDSPTDYLIKKVKLCFTVMLAQHAMIGQNPFIKILLLVNVVGLIRHVATYPQKIYHFQLNMNQVILKN